MVFAVAEMKTLRLVIQPAIIRSILESIGQMSMHMIHDTRDPLEHSSTRPGTTDYRNHLSGCFRLLVSQLLSSLGHSLFVFRLHGFTANYRQCAEDASMPPVHAIGQTKAHIPAEILVYQICLVP